jgi:hypothetical protein
MQVRDRLIQETEGLPEKMLVEMLGFLQVLKGETAPEDAVSTQALVARVEYLETVLGIQKGLASFDRGEGIPADEALESLRQKYNIPRR